MRYADSPGKNILIMNVLYIESKFASNYDQILFILFFPPLDQPIKSLSLNVVVELSYMMKIIYISYDAIIHMLILCHMMYSLPG